MPTPRRPRSGASSGRSPFEDGDLRISAVHLPLFPAAALDFIPVISVLAIIGIIYGALVAMVQTDVKSLVAYSSVSHLGFVMLGLFAFTIQGISGGILQMINHGFSTGALFLIVGMIYERRHTRLIEEFGGLSKVMPVFATFFMIVTLSSIGLPGLNGFVGEFLILLGTFRVNHDIRCFRRYGGDPVRGLHALDVPAGHVRGSNERREQET